MDGDIDFRRRIIIGTISALVCAALIGSICFWYVLRYSTNSFDNNLSSIAPAPTRASSTSPLRASQQALEQSVQVSASTTATLVASQAALQTAAQNNSTSSGSSAQQTQLEASQSALEKAVQQSKGQ